MSEKRRNPYLILGVPYGSSIEVATKAFAKNTKKSRYEENYPYSLEDLTWARNQIKAHLENPTADLSTYRVPADPAALRPPQSFTGVNIPVQALERRTPAVTQQDLAQVMDQIRTEVAESIIDELAVKARAQFEIGTIHLPRKPVVEGRTERPRLRIFGRK